MNTTVERKDVGLTLRVKPQISEDGTIKMVIYQETSNVVPGTLGNQAGLAIQAQREDTFQAMHRI